METYDPNVSTLTQEIDSDAPKVPTGLLRPEKNVDTSQMADFSTPIDEVMPGPNMMLQDEMMMAAPRGTEKKRTAAASANPFGLSDEQFQAAIAGAVAVIAFSKMVQDRIGSMAPSLVGGSGDLTSGGLAVTALIAAALFFAAQRFLRDR
jgi:hypothetical protein